MWKHKKLIIIAGIIAVVLVGSIAGAAIAQTGNPPAKDPSKTLLGRVATILSIDQEKLKSAFQQAQKDMREEALNQRLQNLVSNGKLTQGQADEYKSWLKSKPDMPAFGLGGPGPRGPHFRGFGPRPPMPPPPPSAPTN